MKVEMKRKLARSKSNIQKFYFLDDIQDSLRRASVADNLDSYFHIRYTNFKHHAEIYDIIKIVGEEEKRALKLFEEYSLIVTTEDKKLNIFVTLKNKEDSNGSCEIEGFLNEFKKFLKENVSFIQGNFEEIIFFD